MGAYLDKVVQNTGFSVLGLVDADGIGIDNERNEVEVSGNTLYQQAIRGDVVVGEAVEPVFADKPVLPILVPVLADDGVTPTGALIGGYAPQKLNHLLLPPFDGEGVAIYGQQVRNRNPTRRVHVWKTGKFAGLYSKSF